MGGARLLGVTLWGATLSSEGEFVLTGGEFARGEIVRGEFARGAS